MRCGGRAIDTGLPLINQHLQLLDVALRHDAGVATLQLALDVEFVLGLLKVLLASWVCASALTTSACVVTIEASTSATLRLAVSNAACCFELSSLNSTRSTRRSWKSSRSARGCSVLLMLKTTD